MHRRLHASLAALIAAPLLGGCQMMTHSNMIVFGTNTVVGVRVGTAATQVPSIDVGYTRQEAVLMPVVANVAQTGQAGDGRLVPCSLGTEVKVVAGTPPPPDQPLPVFATPPCLLVASNEREGAKDSYSVLASFGANFGAGSEPSRSTARGGLAQYFATGMAAQLLALNGGAAVVATGSAAESAAAGAPMTLTGVSAPSAAELGAIRTTVTGYQGQMKALTDKVKALDPGKLAANLKAFESAVGSQAGYDLMCTTTSAACAATLTSSAAYLGQYSADGQKFAAAVTAFPTVP